MLHVQIPPEERKYMQRLTVSLPVIPVQVLHDNKLDDVYTLSNSFATTTFLSVQLWFTTSDTEIPACKFLQQADLNYVLSLLRWIKNAQNALWEDLNVYSL